VFSSIYPFSEKKKIEDNLSLNTINFNPKHQNNPKNRKPTPPNEENNKKSQLLSSLESASARAVDPGL